MIKKELKIKAGIAFNKSLFFFFMLFFSMAVAQSQSNTIKPTAQELYQKILVLEDNEKFDEALILLWDLQKKNPSNANYYYKLRYTLTQKNDYKSLLTLQQSWVKRHPRDISAAAEYSILLYKNNQKKPANKIFMSLMSKKNYQNAAQTIFNTAKYYGLDKELSGIIKYLREIRGTERLLAENYCNYLITKQQYQELLKESIRILNYPETSRTDFFPDILFQIPSDSPFFTKLIVNIAQEDTTLNKIYFTSEIYLYQGELENSVHSLLLMSKWKHSFKLQLTVLDKMKKQKYFDSAIKASEIILHQLEDVNDIEKLSMMLASIYEKAFRSSADNLQIIPSSWPSSIIRPEYKSYDIDLYPYIEKALSIYDSLLNSSNNVKLKIEILNHSADIYKLIFNDFDKSLNFMEQALLLSNKETKRPLITNISNIYLAKGDITNMEILLKTAAEKYHLKAKEEDELLIDMIKMTFFFSTDDSLNSMIYSTLALLGEGHETYNDLLHFLYFYEFLKEDSTNFQACVDAELFIQQNKYSEAIAIYYLVLSNSATLKDIAADRILQLIRLRKNDISEREENFWGIFSKFDPSKFTDPLYFDIKLAEYYLFEKNDKEKGFQILESLLLNHPDASRTQEIRPFLRSLSPN